MQCALSGEAPQEPVVSKKSGHVFEKRLIESYIAENHKDPITNEELVPEDLVTLQTARVVKPRPPTLTSIPALLSTFQNEWDALALETFNLQQRVTQLQQELSEALLKNDASERVIARMFKERNEARDALSRVSAIETRNTAASTSNGGTDAMQVDSVAAAGLPADILQVVDETQAKLSQTRRKRPVPDGWTTIETIQNLKPTSTSPKLLAAGSRALHMDPDGEFVFVGGTDGIVSLYSVSREETRRIIQTGDDPVTSVVCLSFELVRDVAVATEKGAVQFFSEEKRTESFRSHNGAITGMALHPSGSILASVGNDQNVVFYNTKTKETLTHVLLDSQLLCCAFHPDGHLLAVGSKSGFIKIVDVKTSAQAAEFKVGSPVNCVRFSENGIWLAASAQNSSSVGIWDLRKAIEIKSLQFSGPIETIEFDYTGQYLAGGGPKCVGVQYYDKAAKKWVEPLMKAENVTALGWASSAKGLTMLTGEGAISLWTA